MLRNLALALFLLPMATLTILPCSAQGNGETPGFLPFTTVTHDAKTYDTINLHNLAVLFSLPVRIKKGPNNLPFSYSIVQNSSVTPFAAVNDVDGNLVRVWSANNPGMQGEESSAEFPVGRIAGYGYGVAPLSYSWGKTKCPNGTVTYLYSNFEFTDGLGTVHYFNSPTYVDSAGCYSSSSVGVAQDGSGYSLHVNGKLQYNVYDLGGKDVSGTIGYATLAPRTNSVTLTDPNGNQITATICDFNCNQITGTPQGITWTDSLTSTAVVTQKTNGELSYSDASGNTQSFTPTIQGYSVKSSFGCPGVLDLSYYNVQNVGTSYTQYDYPTKISLPDGTSFEFTYEQTPGYPTYNDLPATTGRIASITLPTGGAISYTYSGGNNGVNCYDGSVPTLTRTTPDGIWTYTHIPPVAGSATSTTVVTDPLANQTVYTFAGMLETEHDVYHGSQSGGTLLSKTVTCYSTNPACPSPAVAVNYIQYNASTGSLTVTTANNFAVGQSVTFYNVSSQLWLNGLSATITAASSSQFSVYLPLFVPPGYHLPPPGSEATGWVQALPTERDVYTYFAGLSQPSVVATTFNNFSLVTEVRSYDFGGGPNVSGTAPLSDKVITYGSYSGGSCVPVSATIQDRPCMVVIKDGQGNIKAETTYGYDGAGNLLTENRLLSGSTFVTNNFSYAANGALQKAIDGKGAITQYVNNACNNLFPTSITAGGLTSNETWDCNGGVLSSFVDPNQQTTTYKYNDPLYRKTETDYPDSGKTTTTYNDTASPPNQVQSELITSSVPKTVQISFDSLGRTSQTALTSDPFGSDYVDTAYDGRGRVCMVSNPYRGAVGTATCTKDTAAPFTTKVYDALDRLTTQTNQDSSSLTYSYNGNTVTFTDENLNQWQRTSDGLGRLTKVMEPNGTTPAATMETDYGYDALNNLLSVTQWGGVSGSSGGRSRAFSYDDLSRLIRSYNPESGWTCYGTTGGSRPNASNCTEGYDANGNLQYKTDARGITTSYFYDALNRLTSETYSSNDASKTPISCFQYDTSSAPGAGGNLLGRLTNEWTAVAGSSCVAPPSGTYYALRSILSYDAMGRIASEQQCTPSKCSSGSGPAVSYGYDLAGNPTGLTNSVGAVNGSLQTVPLTLTTGFDRAGHVNSVTSNWSSYPTNIYTLNSYGPVGPLNWSLGPVSPSPTLTVTQAYTNRHWVNSIAATGQVP